MTWRALTNHFLSSLFEPPCAACKSVLSHPLDGAVCESCWAATAAMASTFAKAPADKTAARLTSAAFSQRPGSNSAVDWAAAVGEYEGRLRDIIHALKYDGRRSIAPPLGALMRSAGAELLRGADVVVPVPLHPRRERSRGFNQADDLARALGVPVRPLLRRIRYTTSQIELPKDERRRNVHDAFQYRSPEPGARRPAVVVLVDDVATTGATLEACAAVLKAAGAKEVRALTAARVASAPHPT